MQSPLDELELQRTYSARFSIKAEYRKRVWRVLAPWFSRWVPSSATVLDLGAGYCEFINTIQAGKKYAMDLNPDLRQRAAADVTILSQDCSEPWPLPEGSLDVVFTSNFLEHLPNRPVVKTVLTNALHCLKPGGRFIALGPNIKYVPGAYWDFFDHFVELTEASLSEALTMCGFEIEEEIGRFLPYTMSRGRTYPTWMLSVYLALPVVWPIFGKQFLVIGRKPAAPPRQA
jgi:SAM-dependent methyltransferase